MDGYSPGQTKVDVDDLLRLPGEDEPVGFAALPGIRGISDLLEQSKLGWSVATFLILSVGLAFTLGATVLVLTNSIFFFGIAAFIGSATPYMVARRKRQQRFDDFEEQFPEAIDLLTRAIRAGHPISSGMQMVGDEGPPEVAEEFRRTFDEQKFGLPFEEAMMGLVYRTDMVDVRIFAIAVLIQREVGGNLAEILDGLGNTIRKRFFLRRQLRVYTAQGRMTGYALAVLPILVGLGIFVLEAELIMLLFTTLPGWIMVGSAVFLQFIGVLWIRSIVNVDM
jgi:tight adherence protein B